MGARQRPKLKYYFHNPNPPEVTAKHIANVLVEAHVKRFTELAKNPEERLKVAREKGIKT